MTIRGAWGARTGWVRRALRNGRFAWGPSDPADSFIVGASQTGYTPASGEQTRMFFDTATGSFRAGTCTSNNWDGVNLGGGSFAVGPKGGIASGLGSIALGGGVSGGSATGTSSVSIAGGIANRPEAVAIGYSASVANAGQGGWAMRVGDSGGAISNVTGAVAFGGGEITSSGTWGFALGYAASATRNYQFAWAGGKFAAIGDAQKSWFVLRKSTTDATPTELALDGSAAYLTIPASNVMSGTIRIVARRTDVQGDNAAWPDIQFAVARDSSGDCRLLGAVTGAGTTTLCDAGASTWSVAVTADTTNQRLAITVTGEAGKTIRWVASVDLVEVGG